MRTNANLLLLKCDMGERPRLILVTSLLGQLACRCLALRLLQPVRHAQAAAASTPLLAVCLSCIPFPNCPAAQARATSARAGGLTG